MNNDNLVVVLERLIKLAEDDFFAESFSDSLDNLLDDIHSQDGFGTEGQLDHRGDFRNGNWNIWDIEEK